MAVPITNFGYSRNGLEVTFQNLTLNTEDTTTYLWDFGNATTQAIKNPLPVLYAEEGFYTVTLTVTNEVDEEDSISMYIGVGSSETILLTPIYQLVNYYLPSTIVAGNKEKILSSIQHWQLYLQPLVEVPNTVELADIHNEFKWPALVNVLISQLVALDIITYETSRFILDLSNQATSSSSNTTTNTTTSSPRSIKAIETGPTKVEWYNAKEVDAEIIKNITSSGTSGNSDSGILFLLKQSTCQLSKRLNIFLPNCGPLNNQVINFQISKSPITRIPRSTSIGNILEEIMYVWDGNFEL